MRIAAIGDVHGNSAALEAVLRDVDRVGSDLVVNLGDHVSGPLDAAGTAELIAGRDMLCIRGNHDRWLLERARDEMGPSDRVADEQLVERDRSWLASLVPTATVEDMDGAVRCVGEGALGGAGRAPRMGPRPGDRPGLGELTSVHVEWILESGCCSP